MSNEVPERSNLTSIETYKKSQKNKSTENIDNDNFDDEEVFEKHEKNKLYNISINKHLTADEAETLRKIIRFFEDNESQLKEIVVQQKISELWIGVRLRVWSAIKWVLTTFLLVIAVVEGYTRIISTFFKQ